MNKSEYQLYLASREWALKREAVRDRSGGKCERCHLRDMEAVHHRTYERVGHEHLDDLVAICNPCHEFLSGKSDYDPRKDITPFIVEKQVFTADGMFNLQVACPFCGSDYLHYTRVEVFERATEDAPSQGISVGHFLVEKTTIGHNPSSRRDGILIYFWCEGCRVGSPPHDGPEDGFECYELPAALAIAQHKGVTFVEWVAANETGGCLRVGDHP